MNIADAKLGLEVVRSKGANSVGCKGVIHEIDAEKGRIRVSWGTWVRATAVEPTSIPYEITPPTEDKETGKITWQKYVRL